MCTLGFQSRDMISYLYSDSENETQINRLPASLPYKYFPITVDVSQSPCFLFHATENTPCQGCVTAGVLPPSCAHC